MNKHVSKLLQPGVFWYCLVLLAFAVAAALLDQYYVLRASSHFFLAEDGSYSGAVEQIIQELGTDENRKTMRMELQTAYLAEHLKEDEKIELLYQYERD